MGGDAGLAEGADYGRRGHFISKREHLVSWAGDVFAVLV